MAVSRVAGEYRPASAPNNAITVAVSDNDDPLPEITIVSADGSGSEGGTITYDFRLASASDGSIEIAYSGTGGNAIFGTDYTFAAASPLTFTDTATMGSIVVNLEDDDLNEAVENFTLNLDRDQCNIYWWPNDRNFDWKDYG